MKAAAFLAPAWSLGYGLLALAWALGGAAYPFDPDVDPDARLALLGHVAPGAGAAGLAILGLLGAVVGAAMVAGRGRGSVSGRRLAIGLGAGLALTYAVMLTDFRVLVVTAYTPILLALAPFGWPPGVSLGDELTWPLVHQLVLMAGGIAWAAATVRYRRLTANACERCGRVTGTVDARGAARAARWGRRAVAVAVVIPLLYAATRWAWALGVPLGIPEATLRADMATPTWFGGFLLANVAAAGALLTTGLVLRWGEVVPGRVPWLGGRRIPPIVAIVPASLMTVVITAAGVSFVRVTLLGDVPFRWAEWGILGPTLLWPAWGAALGVATLAYAYRRRGPCGACGPRPAYRWGATSSARTAISSSCSSSGSSGKADRATNSTSTPARRRVSSMASTSSRGVPAMIVRARPPV